ncbi:MerR family transcriptional regulator, partial [Staphylococcus aureus]
DKHIAKINASDNHIAKINASDNHDDNVERLWERK